MIEEIQSAIGHGRRRICQVLGVPRSSYYHAARPTVTQQSDDDIGIHIQAIHTRKPAPGLIFHSDRGSQYGSGQYRALLDQAGIRQSMSARANPYHNAWTESFMGTLKREMLRGGTFINEADARTEIFAFIEGYYNTHRRHSSLDYPPRPSSKRTSTH